MNLKSRAVLAGAETDLLDFLIFVAVLFNKLVPEGLHRLPGLAVPPLHDRLNADPQDGEALVVRLVRLTLTSLSPLQPTAPGPATRSRPSTLSGGSPAGP